MIVLCLENDNTSKVRAPEVLARSVPLGSKPLVPGGNSAIAIPETSPAVGVCTGGNEIKDSKPSFCPRACTLSSGEIRKSLCRSSGESPT